jgi:hypothetical protein
MDYILYSIGSLGSSGEIILTIPVLSEGLHNFNATMTDNTGNVSTTSNTISIIEDLTSPNKPILSTNSTAYTKNNTIIFTLCGEALSSYSFYKYNDLIASGTINSVGNAIITVSGIVDGSYSFYAILSDTAGNISINSNSIQITVDTQPPIQPVFLTQSGQIPTRNATITISGEPQTFYTLSYNSINISNVVSLTGISTIAVSSLSGTTNFYIILSDLAGNTSTLSNVLTLTVFNSVPPTPSLVVSLNASQVATYTISGLINTTYALYNGTALLTTATMTSSNIVGSTNPLSPGKYYFRVRLQNSIGWSGYSSISTITVS